MKGRSDKRFAPKFKIKKGDKVIVISGSNKGKTGEVLQVIPDKERVVIADVNLVKKHRKPTANDAGGIVEIPAPVHISNVQIVDPKTGTASRVGRKVVDGEIVRYSKKSGEIIK
ncbi:MAG: 50S ribosomal protein L24 [Saprospiraceae bacterium]|jgi:large subunit ribosomal protein L24|nr:50S ribosomal protein L24 [Saprospiraceae bacterium]